MLCRAADCGLSSGDCVGIRRLWSQSQGKGRTDAPLRGSTLLRQSVESSSFDCSHALLDRWPVRHTRCPAARDAERRRGLADEGHHQGDAVPHGALRGAVLREALRDPGQSPAADRTERATDERSTHPRRTAGSDQNGAAERTQNAAEFLRRAHRARCFGMGCSDEESQREDEGVADAAVRACRVRGRAEIRSRGVQSSHAEPEKAPSTQCLSDGADRGRDTSGRGRIRDGKDEDGKNQVTDERFSAEARHHDRKIAGEQEIRAPYRQSCCPDGCRYETQNSCFASTVLRSASLLRLEVVRVIAVRD